MFGYSFLYQIITIILLILMLPHAPGKDLPIIISSTQPVFTEIINENLPWINKDPGPYDYKLFFEGNYYPHSINLSKLSFIIKHQNQLLKKNIFLTTGHSLADTHYMTDFGCVIKKTSNLSDLFLIEDNLFYSVDEGFIDFALVSFGAYNINRLNNLNFLNKSLKVSSIYKNPHIKNLELDFLIKNGYNTGESFAQAVIDFSYDPYIHTINNGHNFFTFKLAGGIVVISTPYASGFIIKGRESKLSKYIGNQIDFHTQNMHLEYNFINTIKAFKSFDLFNGYTINDSIKYYFNKYTADNKLSVLSLMGDSGSGFYKLDKDNQLKFLGINVGLCYMIVLKSHGKWFDQKQIYYDEQLNKLVVGQYYIEEVHKASQILPIATIESYIKNIPGSIVEDITI